MKTMIILSGYSVYHECDCHHLKRTPKSKWESITTEEAEKRHYRPCVHCGTVGFHMRYEQKVLDRIIKGRNMEYRVVRNAMYVKTDISCWKIVYNPAKLYYMLYHRNRSAEPLDFNHPEREEYHRQTDKKSAATMAELFQYLRSHDAFRKSEQNAAGDLKKINVNSKYRAQYRSKVLKKQRRKERVRLEKLFAAIEQNNPEYAALAFH